MSDTHLLSVFVDGGYLFHAFTAYREQGRMVSVKRLIRRLDENYTLARVHYSDAINLRDPVVKKNQEAFYYGKLKGGLGWHVMIEALQYPGGRAKQKGTDASLMLQLYESAIADEYGTAILICADADFVRPVKRVI